MDFIAVIRSIDLEFGKGLNSIQRKNVDVHGC